MQIDLGKAKELFLAVLEMSALERAAYLDTACAGDTALRHRIEAMLRNHENSGELLPRSAKEMLGGNDATEGSVAADLESPGAPSHTLPDSAVQRNDDPLAYLSPSTEPGHLGRLGHYEIQEVIGKGGFGTVLKAFDEKLHRVVAIKILAPELAASGVARVRFAREARAGAAVTHEHVVAIYAVDPEHRPPYFVMQLIDGMTLQQKLDKVGILSLKEILRIGMQMAEGLAAAHRQGLVHRDIKPANILLENGVERVKITDFGLARAVDDASTTQSGTVAGTPMYMSPEQAEGLPIDHRSDLFSLGTVLYAMCTGHPPFRASGTHAVLKRVIDALPRPIREINNEIPDWLCDIIAKLHAKKPEDRFQTANEVAELLGRHLAQVQQPNYVAPTPKKVEPRDDPDTQDQFLEARVMARHLAITLPIVAVAFFALIAVGYIWFPAKKPALLVTADDPAIRVTITGQDRVVNTDLKPDEWLRLEPGKYNVVVQCGAERKIDSVLFSESEQARTYSDEKSEDGFEIQLKEDQRVTLIVKTSPRLARPAESPWVQLFNGKDLTGWKRFPADKEIWRVKDGILVGQGAECSMLPSDRDNFRDFHLRVEAKINDGGDSGVWFRTDLKSQDGYEANINHSYRDSARTGSLGIKMNHKQKWLHHQNNSLAPANTWFTLEVVAAGPNFTVKVDGVTVAQVTDTNRSVGHIGLEMFGKGSVAHFRKIEIKELPRE